MVGTNMRIVVYLSIFVLLIAGLVVNGTGEVSADSWSWLSGNIELMTKQQLHINDPMADECRGLKVTGKLKGSALESQGICLATRDEGWARIGVTLSNLQRPITAMLSVDTEEYLPVLGCDGYFTCMYSARYDTLIFRQSTSQPYFTVHLYPHFSQRVTMMPDGSAYRLPPDSQRVTFTNTDDIPIASGGVGISKNGRWLAIEQYHKGVALMDIKTQEVRVVVTASITGDAFGSSVLLDVSDDGRVIAYGGTGAMPAIVEVRSDCGVKNGSGSVCPTLNLPVYEWVGDLVRTATPNLSAEGGVLTTVYIGSTGTWQVSIRAFGYHEAAIEYLALGDSFTSGEGETEDGRYQYLTNQGRDICHVSERSYPYVAASMIGVVGEIHNVACSGATIPDVDGRGNYFGQQSRLLEENGQAPSDDALTTLRQTSLLQFIPGRIRQADFVSYYRPKFITVGIGGNDVGLIDKLKACLMPGPTCNWALEGKRTQVKHEIEALRPKLAQLYGKLQDASPSSRIFAVGYPKIINELGRCSVAIDVSIDNTEKTFINQVLILLNIIIRQASLEAGVGYISVEEAFKEHAICDDSPDKAMNELRYGAGIGIGPVQLFARESFHPTPYGHALLGRIVSGQLAASERTVTQQTDAEYWYEDVSDAEQPKLERTIMLSDDGEQYIQGQSISITLPDDSLQPGSNARVLVHSKEYVLGEAAVGERGAVSGNFTLPQDLDPGYHTISVVGINRDQKLVEYYQTFSSTVALKNGVYQMPLVMTVLSPAGAPPLNLEEDKSVAFTESTEGSGLADVLGAMTNQFKESNYSSSFGHPLQVRPNHQTAFLSDVRWEVMSLLVYIVIAGLILILAFRLRYG